MKSSEVTPRGIRVGRSSGFEFVELEGLEIGWVHVTPEIATEWLDERNKKNRKTKKLKLASFTEDMRNLNWDVNGESIIFNNEGVLTDGQHRLKAVVDSGEAQYMLVVFGVSPDSQDTVDTGSARHMADQLHMKGFSNSILLASTASLVLRVNSAYANNSTYVGMALPSHSDMITFINENERIHRAAEVARAAKASPNLDVSPSGIGAVFFYLDEIDPFMAEEFIVNQVIGGLRWTDGSPAKALVERFSSEKKITGHAFGPAETIAYTISAWNAYRESRSITRLQAPRNGLVRFPVPK